MKLNKIQDPRDALEKARRKELERFAAANNVTEIDPRMPASIMRQILRKYGLTDIRIPERTIGQSQPGTGERSEPSVSNGSSQNGVETDALSDLMRQWKSEQQPAPEPEAQPQPAPEPDGQEASVLRDLDMQEQPKKALPKKALPKMAALRKQAKELGVKQSRRDTMESLQAKLDAHLNGAGDGEVTSR